MKYLYSALFVIIATVFSYGQIVINEIYSTDNNVVSHTDFIELYSSPWQNLDGYSVVLFDSNNGGNAYAVFDLTGYSTNESGYFIICNSSIYNTPLSYTFEISNTLDILAENAGIAIYDGPYNVGMQASSSNLVDGVVYGQGSTQLTNLLNLLGNSAINAGSDSHLCRNLNYFIQSYLSPLEQNFPDFAHGCYVFGSCNFNMEAYLNDLPCIPSGCVDQIACNYNPNAGCSDDMWTGVSSCVYPGCTDSYACNFNPNAGCDDGTCTYPGCNDVFACNYNSSAGCSNGSCLYAGCNDPLACNFNPLSGCNDGSCLYPGCNQVDACNYNPNAGCDNGSCVFPGCNDEQACNYYSLAGCDDGSCIFPGCINSEACNFDPSAGCDNSTCTFPGCTNSIACNYNSNAGCDNGSCIMPGCTHIFACNYDSSAGCDNGTCIFPNGCTDPFACNFNPTATCDDGSCIIAGCTNESACNYNSNADCDNGSCIFPGCMDPSACNYNSDAGCDNGSCYFCSPTNQGVICTPGESTMLCSNPYPWSPGSWSFNGVGMETGGYCISVSEPGYYTAYMLNYFTGQQVTAGYNVYFEETYTPPIITCAYATNELVPDSIVLTASGGQCYLWSNGSFSQSITVPNSGGLNTGGVWVQVRNENCCPHIAMPSTFYTIPGCTDANACNYNINADCNDGSCVYPGCNDVDACNYNVSAGCDDGSCLYGNGCTNPLACNYDISAQCDNGSCVFPGCTNLNAQNYDPSAACDDGSCLFLVTFQVNMSQNITNIPVAVGGSFDFWGMIGNSFLSDTNGDNIWTTTLNLQQGTQFYLYYYDDGDGPFIPENLSINGACSTLNDQGIYSRTFNLQTDTILPVVCWGGCFDCNQMIGCMDPVACNFDSNAHVESGNCLYGGCTDVNACNFDPSANCDLGTCVYPGCTNSMACNFNPSSGCNDGSCILPGCMDPLACNYDPATICGGVTCVYPGCTNPQGCNYNPLAGCDDGSCHLTYASCSDGDPNTIMDFWYNLFPWEGIECTCIGQSFQYGSVGNSNQIICPEISSVQISTTNNPSIGIYPLGVNSLSYSLQWYFKTGNNTAPSGSNTSGWNIIPGATASTLTVDAFTGTRTYACFVTPDASYGISGQWMSGAKVLTYSSFAAQTIIGNPNITPFNAYNYIVNPIPGHTYNWTVVNGAVASGQGTNNVSIMWGQSGPYQLILTESDGTCSGSSYLFAVNNNCSISVSAASSTNNTFCAGTTLQLQAATSATGITYQWYLNGTLIPNETNQNISVSAGGNYQVSINQNGCTAISNIVSINQLPSAIIPSILVEQANAGCAGGEATLTVSGGTYTNLLWNNGLTASSININASGDFSITAIDENGCAVSAGPVSVNFSILDPVPVCIVTVDQLTGKNNVVWEPVTSDLINSYAVFKETNVASEYMQIGTVAYGSDGIFEDVNSDPQIQANRYKLALIDTCGILSSTSNFHKTIHLTANQGVGSNVNLIWSDYEGFDFGSYSIYRGSSASSLNLLTTIASNLNSFTDVNPPVGETFYMIEVAGVSCDPQRTLVYSHSNILDSTVGIEEFTSTRISLYPNPASTTITLQVNTSLIGEEYVVFDAVGKVIYKNKIQSTNELIQLENFNNGNYFIKVNEAVKRFVVQK